MTYPEPRAYECSTCRKWWMRPAFPVGCLVIHQPGSCCHYGEAECAAPVPLVPQS